MLLAAEHEHERLGNEMKEREFSHSSLLLLSPESNTVGPPLEDANKTELLPIVFNSSLISIK